MNKSGILLCLLLIPAVFLSSASHAAENTIADKKVLVRYDSPLQGPASEVIRVYPLIHEELKKDLGWRTVFRPEVILVKDSVSFRKFSENDLVTAIAIPNRDLIVIDHSKMNISPFTLEATLKHELCHLELHRHIPEGKLPKWLDEGVCQWVTGGLAEIMTYKNRSALRTATLSGRLFTIERLTDKFPADDKDLILAYEESISIVEYIEKEFGSSGLRKILEHMSNGESVEKAIHKSLMIPLDELERRWRSSLDRRTSWFFFMSNNLYEILFSIAALIAMYGFFVRLKKKRAYKDEDEGEEKEN